ncbi:MAG: hypothetical protein MPK62_10860, partial [Alphaproteobacteria bacterium]|nr:hypothetical protein [Alphaproteobacteria bacterium]
MYKRQGELGTGVAHRPLTGDAARFVNAPRGSRLVQKVVIDDTLEDDTGLIEGETLRPLVEARAANPTTGIAARDRRSGLYHLILTPSRSNVLGADWRARLEFAATASGGGVALPLTLADGNSDPGCTLSAGTRVSVRGQVATVTFDDTVSGASPGAACIIVRYGGADGPGASDGGPTDITITPALGVTASGADARSWITPKIEDSVIERFLEMEDGDAFQPQFVPEFSGVEVTGTTLSETSLANNRQFKLKYRAPTGPIPGLASGTVTFTPNVADDADARAVTAAPGIVTYTAGTPATRSPQEQTLTFNSDDRWTNNAFVQESRTFKATMTQATVPSGAQVADAERVFTIEDDEAAIATVAFVASGGSPSAAAYEDSVDEDVSGGSVTVPVTVSHAPLTATDFTVEVVRSSTATEGGGNDFTIASKTVTFAAKTATLTQLSLIHI